MFDKYKPHGLGSFRGLAKTQGRGISILGEISDSTGEEQRTGHRERKFRLKNLLEQSALRSLFFRGSII